MRSSRSPNPTLEAQSGDHLSTDRTWFLVDSTWQDPVWLFKPTNALEESRPVRLRWNFTLPSGRCFTDERYAPLLEYSRQLVALIRGRSLSTGLAQRASTVAGYFQYLRELVRWMDQAGFVRFADLDAAALLAFQRSLMERPGVARAALAPTTVQKYLYLFTYLYRFRNDLGDGLQFDPFAGRSHGEVAGVRDADIRRWPHTPDSVAIALVQGAIDLVTNGATSILRARQVYTKAMAAARQRGCRIDARTNAATRALQQAAFDQPEGAHPIRTVDDLAHMIDMLYAACFVVISYLVGPRASEILHLQAGCVQHRDEEAITVIVGAIFKRQAEYHGRPHEWVAPPPAVQAISVLEALSAGHRAQTGRSELWLRRCRTVGATEWQQVCPGQLQIVSTTRMRVAAVPFCRLAWRT